MIKGALLACANHVKGQKKGRPSHRPPSARRVPGFPPGMTTSSGRKVNFFVRTGTVQPLADLFRQKEQGQSTAKAITRQHVTDSLQTQ